MFVFLKSQKVFHDQHILHFFVSLQFDPSTQQGKSALKELILNRQSE